MSNFLFSLSYYQDVALIILRFVIGAIFVRHGMEKLKHAKGNFLALGFAEMAGAIGMFMGLFTQFAALGLAIVMCGAFYMKKFRWKTPFSSHTTTGYELDLMILAGLIMLILVGGGNFSLDRIWFDL